jgi:hypothetical protein
MNNIHIVNLAAYEPPVIRESKRDNWVEYGENNMHYQWCMIDTSTAPPTMQ